VVEEPDLQVFRDPESEIIRPGGEIFFAVVDGEPLGTCALIRHGDGVFELAKMGVSPRAQGHGLGARLMEAAIGFARERGGARIELLTNSVLGPALRLYERHGFRRVPVAAHEGGYERVDVKMVLDLSAVTR
jgi:GNAT superfamily N-acetyltransferase